MASKEGYQLGWNADTCSAHGQEARDEALRAYRQLLYPSRIDVLRLIHSRREIPTSDIEKSLDLGFHAVTVSLEVLERLGLVAIYDRPNPGHGRHRVAVSNIPEHKDHLTVSVVLQFMDS